MVEVRQHDPRSGVAWRDIRVHLGTSVSGRVSAQRRNVCEGRRERGWQRSSDVEQTGQRVLPAQPGGLEARGLRAANGRAEMTKAACYDSPDWIPAGGEFHARGNTTTGHC